MEIAVYALNVYAQDWNMHRIGNACNCLADWFYTYTSDHPKLNVHKQKNWENAELIDEAHYSYIKTLSTLLRTCG